MSVICTLPPRRRIQARRTSQLGWGASEYLSVLLGLIAVWWGAQQVLALVREHHDEFTWALMLPF